MNGTSTVDSGWLHGAARLRDSGTPFVLVTVVQTRGSVPRETGTRMLVTAQGTVGTIGGGHLEHEAMAIARRHLRLAVTGAHWQAFALGARLGQCCGGAVELMFELEVGAALDWIDVLHQALQRGEAAVIASVVDGVSHTRLVLAPSSGAWQRGEADATTWRLARDLLTTPALTAPEGPPSPRKNGPRRFVQRIEPPGLDVWVHGAGHVGRALVAVLGLLPCRVTWVDSRPDEFPSEVPPNVRVLCSDDGEHEVDEAPPGACHLVMTHSHALDFELSLRLLRRADFRYFGLIGSATKRRSFEHRLADRGIDRAMLCRMRCPIGIDGVSGKEPGVIAVAVAAQLLGLREEIARGPEPMGWRNAGAASARIAETQC
ncbi:MAG: xanthine dehydrogenase accessory protein XdhC [Hydrogenophaga sp.]|uniref:xanthine dehydrogenase accessory protein XdhC n=1 Tax=Hydrogenophaga sp. TaxID=1904254 RepID=UPI004035B390